jgi:lipoate-protein ligase A
MMKTKGVQSVRSPVVNLSAIVPGLDHEAFIRAVVREFRAEYDVDVDEEVALFPVASNRYLRHTGTHDS